LVKKSFVLRELDVVRVVGREQSVRVYELLARADTSLPLAQEKACNSYAAGLEAYRQHRWNEAQGLFEEALAFWPGDGPAQTMMARCQLYQAVPPSEEWDGVFEQLYK
jgi:adenylate cyclase